MNEINRQAVRFCFWLHRINQISVYNNDIMFIWGWYFLEWLYTKYTYLHRIVCFHCVVKIWHVVDSINSQLLSMKLYTSIVYGILHMLWKFKGKYYNESWDIKRCINGGTLSNFVNFGSFSIHLQTGISQCKMYVRVSFWCHRKAHGLVSYFMKYQQPRIKSWFTNDT